MKARPFLAVLLAILLVLGGLGLGGWWLVWWRSPLRLQRQTPALPRAARFVPRQADLALYLLSDGRQPVDYARAVAPLPRRRAAAAAVERLRDGAFAAAGLDYASELASWLAPQIALALFEPGDPQGQMAGSAPQGWLLALGSRDDGGARRFLQRFWQTRSLAGTDLQVSTYRGMGLISGRGALAGRPSLPLATALVDDDLVLIASGRGVLEQALDASQIDGLNQAGVPALRQAAGRFGPAAALLLARPGAIEQWLGLPALGADRGRTAAVTPGRLQPGAADAAASRRIGWVPPGWIGVRPVVAAELPAAATTSAAADQGAAAEPAASLSLPEPSAEQPPEPPASTDGSVVLEGGPGGEPPSPDLALAQEAPAPLGRADAKDQAAAAEQAASLPSLEATGRRHAAAVDSAADSAADGAADRPSASPKDAPEPLAGQPPEGRDAVAAPGQLAPVQPAPVQPQPSQPARTPAPQPSPPAPGLPSTQGPVPRQLVAALRPEGTSLLLQADLEWSAPLPAAVLAVGGEADPALLQALLAGLHGPVDSLALLSHASAWTRLPALRPLLSRILAGPSAGPLPALVAAEDDGLLLAADGPHGWLLGSAADHPAPNRLEEPLAANGLFAAPLQQGETNLLVWTRLQALPGRAGRRSREGAEQLQATLTGWWRREGELAWWGRNLGQLQASPSRRARQQIESLEAPTAPLRWALLDDRARALLQPWQPWRLLTALAGGGLDPAIRGVTLALEPSGAHLLLQARLDLG